MTPAGATPQLNKPFLCEVLHHIETHQKQWSQSSWVDETASVTTYCFAGWAYVLGTGEHFFNVDDLVLGATRPLAATAAQLLGLTGEQAARIFFYLRKRYPRNPDGWGPITFADLCRRVYEVTGFRYRPGLAVS